MTATLLALACLIVSVFSCADHTGRQRGALAKRQEVSRTNPSHITKDWAYDASYNWGAISPDYITCHIGTNQSPLALSLTAGLAHYHHPTFSGYENVSGNFSNWGYGPAYNLSHPADDWTTLPVLRWDNETAYLKGWHIHTPADHSVGGDRSKAELHLVHVNSEGHETAVLAIRLDPGTSEQAFFSQLPTYVPYHDPKPVQNVKLNINLILEAVYYVTDFWTYQGSLTSPPCREGIRWFVARNIVFTSSKQMQDILRVSTFSAREEQEVWLHGINSA